MSTYRDLLVWQKAMDLTKMIYRLTASLPAEEKYALSDQLRRAAVSIPSNIAEGQGRNSPREFSRFLSIARGSCFEAETQLEIAVRQGWLTQEEIRPALSLSDEVARMLSALLLKLP